MPATGVRAASSVWVLRPPSRAARTPVESAIGGSSFAQVPSPTFRVMVSEAPCTASRPRQVAIGKDIADADRREQGSDRPQGVCFAQGCRPHGGHVAAWAAIGAERDYDRLEDCGELVRTTGVAQELEPRAFVEIDFPVAQQ